MFRTVERKFGSFCLLLLLWGVQLATSEPLPRTPDIVMPTQDTFSSTDFKTTDEVCLHMYNRWLASLRGVGQQTSRKTKLPLVISYDVRLMKNERLQARCKDFRILARLERAIQEHGEILVSERFYLQCNEETEESDFLQVPSNAASRHLRTIGICRPKDKGQTSESQSTLVKAGSSACINAQNVEAAALMAFLEQDTYDPDSRAEDAYADWLKIIQVGTSRQVSSVGESSATMAVDRKHPSTYRACAKQRAGHGDARLFLVPL